MIDDRADDLWDGDLDEAMDMRAERREALQASELCPSCRRTSVMCHCQHRCQECGGLTNHTTAQHLEAAGAMDNEGP